MLFTVRVRCARAAAAALHTHHCVGDAATQPEPTSAPQDIDSWLAAANLEKYCEAIKEYGYDSFAALRGATEADIKEMMVDPDIKMKKPQQRLMLTAWHELTRGS